MDVAGQDQLCTGVDEAREDMTAAGHRPLARSPWSADNVMMERDHAQRTVRRFAEQLGRPAQLRVAKAAGLVPPRPYGVQADEEEGVGSGAGLGRLPRPPDLANWPREPRGDRMREVVVAGNREPRQSEALQEADGQVVTP